MKRLFPSGACLVLTLAVLTGCAHKAAALSDRADRFPADVTLPEGAPVSAPEYEVNPDTFSLILKAGDTAVTASLPGERREVSDLKKDGASVSWTYPKEEISVSIIPKENYLNVTLTSLSEEANEFFWPNVSGDSYYIPFGEGKRIPAEDEVWNSHLSGREYSAIEQLSMPFWSSVSGGHAALYMTEQPSRVSLLFLEGSRVSFSVRQEFPAVSDEKEHTFRLYLTDSNPATPAKLYRSAVLKRGALVTLEEKAAQNPDIRKLYGAPHIYLWGERLISPEDINWPALRLALRDTDGKSRGLLNHICEMAARTETAGEAAQVFSQLREQDYADRYQKQMVCRTLSEILKSRDFFKPELFEEYRVGVKSFPQSGDTSGELKDLEELIKKYPEELDDSQWIQLNKLALAASLPDVFQPAKNWAADKTTELLADWKDAGIEKAWIGLDNWEQAYAKPELVEAAVSQGYLIGPYDSYHSIHQPGEEQWITAAFGDPSLYETAFITSRSGEPEYGFNHVGRKLSPLLSLPAVIKRTETILDTVPGFNSWFIDCDATGEIYDDYTPGRSASKEEDLNARLERMKYIRDQRGMVIGSEGGNDFAAPVLAFAHGIELPSFSWMDPDMKSRKDSEYYIGRYYSPSGGVPEHFAKPVPLKDSFYHVFADPRYDLPLYKLVYNDSVITSYHWDWSTYKIRGVSEDRMLREILYNTPPMYHLDREQWDTYRDSIISHLTVWSPFSSEAVRREMTDFRLLNADGSVQQTCYGDGLSVTANFGDTAVDYGTETILPHSLLLEQDGKWILYTPDPVNK